MTLKVIARIYSGFSEKFGIPRQSGMVNQVKSRIIFEPEYRNIEALRGLEEFSHIWLLWGFSKVEGWSPTVRPPRLGGNARMGVFATRSPFRPNAIGLSSVQIEKIAIESEGPVIYVQGADIMDGTPIYDIKPYLTYADCHTDAAGGFAAEAPEKRLTIQIDEQYRANVPKETMAAIEGLLAYDPRPRYQDDPQRVYGMSFGGFNIKFIVNENILIVRDIIQEE